MKVAAWTCICMCAKSQLTVNSCKKVPKCTHAAEESAEEKAESDGVVYVTDRGLLCRAQWAWAKRSAATTQQENSAVAGKATSPSPRS